MKPSAFEERYAPGAIGQGHKWRTHPDGELIDVTRSATQYTVECEVCGLRLVAGTKLTYVQPCMETIIV